MGLAAQPTRTGIPAMKRLALGIIPLILLLAGPAAAQATRTWVSGVGDDVNPCSRTAPCKTFAGAISKTAAGGEISTLDPGGFGTVTITKSISITNDNSGEAGVLASSTNGITINAGDTDIVNLRGLVIDGGPPSISGLLGVRFLNGGVVNIQNCVIKNFRGSNGAGISFPVPALKVAELNVKDTIVSSNGAGTGGGILVTTLGAGSKARVTLDNVSVIDSNVQAITADSTASDGNGFIRMTIKNSLIGGTNGGTGNAVTLRSNTSISTVMIERSSLVNNGGTALRTTGSNGSIYVGNSNISGNGSKAFSVAGGPIFTFSSNQVAANDSASDPTTPIAPQ